MKNISPFKEYIGLKEVFLIVEKRQLKKLVMENFPALYTQGKLSDLMCCLG